MPGWAGSSWYFLRYMDPKNEGRFASPEAINYWQQVDLYVGGSEHATGHLLYVRFWTKFLHDRGWIPFDEPAKKLVNQGMIQGRSAKVFRPLFGLEQAPGVQAATEDEAYAALAKSPILVSAEIQSLMAQGGKVGAEASAYLEQATKEYALRILSDHGISGYKPYYDHGVGPLVRVYIPSATTINDGVEVDTTLLRQSSSEFKDAHFLTWGNRFSAEREVDKMSKRWMNVVNPDDIIERYGADTLRLYEMFLGPLEQSKPWDTNGIEGTFRFLRKFWNLFHEEGKGGRGSEGGEDAIRVTDEAPTKPELKVLHATLKKVTEDIEKMSFNTSVAQFMIAANELGALKCNKRAVLEPLVIALAPFAPHIAEELWEKLGHTTSVTMAPWPKWDTSHLVEDSFSYPISFNGKTRMQLEFPIGLSKEEVGAAVLANPEVQAKLGGQPPKKVIVVPKRIVNIVV